MKAAKAGNIGFSPAVTYQKTAESQHDETVK